VEENNNIFISFWFSVKDKIIIEWQQHYFQLKIDIPALNL
jgi:hypothetical protein